MRVPAALAAACGVLLTLGCLDFDEQHIHVEHDQEADRLVVVIDYEALYASRDQEGNLTPESMQEAADQLEEAFQLRKIAVYDNHQYTFSQEGQRAQLMGFGNITLGVLDDLQWLVEHTTVLNAGFYLDARGRLCGAQVVIIEPFAEFVTRANRSVNAAVLAGAAINLDDTDLLAMAGAALAGHVWWRVDGHSSTVSLPMTEDEMHEQVRSWTADELASDAAGHSELQHPFALVLANPVQLWHAEGAMHVKVGTASESSLYVTRPDHGRYLSNLVEHVRETYGLELDGLLARYLLEPEAYAETEAERAARIMAPRLATEAKVRVLIHQLSTAPSEPYRQMLRDVGADLAQDGPSPDLTDEELIEFWRQKRGGASGQAPPLRGE